MMGQAAPQTLHPHASTRHLSFESCFVSGRFDCPYRLPKDPVVMVLMGRPGASNILWISVSLASGVVESG